MDGLSDRGSIPLSSTQELGSELNIGSESFFISILNVLIQ